MGSADFTGSFGYYGRGCWCWCCSHRGSQANAARTSFLSFLSFVGVWPGAGRNSDIQAAVLHATSLVVLPVSNLGKVPTNLGHSSF